MPSQQRLLPETSLLLLIALAMFLPLQMFAQQERGQEMFLCGDLPRGEGNPAGEHGIVDRFNNRWAPSKQLVEAQRKPRLSQAADCGGIRIDFEDVIQGNRIGFDDRTPVVHPILGATTRGEIRQRTICEVARYIGDVLEIKGRPDLLIRASQTDGSGFLAAASPFFTNATAGAFTGGAMFDHITTGIDPTPAPGNYDAFIIFDFGPWTIGGVAYPINDDWSAPADGRLDLFSIALHEATHTLGFLSLIAPGGGSGLNGAFSRFDRGIHSRTGAPLVDPVTAQFVGTAADVESNTLRFHGRNCDMHTPVYSPSPYRPGSSLSHFDSYRSATRYVMHPSTGGGEDRKYAEEEMQALCDIGYTLRNGACSNCAPTGIDDTASTKSGIEICANVLANDIDPGGSALEISDGSVVLQSGSGIVEVRDGRICYAPPSDFTGRVVITYSPTNGARIGNRTRLVVMVTRDRSGDRGLDSGLVAYWPFDDSTANDRSGNGNHGAMNGGPNAGPGVCGASMGFDGADDYIRVPNAPTLQAMTRMTLSYWVRLYCVDGVGNTIGNGSDDYPYARGFYTYHGPEEISHFLGLQPNGRGLRMPYDGTTPLAGKPFTHVVFVVSDDSLKIYRNGCLVAETTRDGWPITRDWDWFIGWSGDRSGDGKFLEGDLDEIRLYDRVLSNDEIFDLYAMCGGRRGLVADPSFADAGHLACPRSDTTFAIRIDNLSAADVVVDATLGIGRDFSVVGESHFTIDSSGSATIMIRFAPREEGESIDTLVIDGGACGSMIRILLTGSHSPCADSIRAKGTDVMLSKTASHSEAYPGDTVTYTMSVWNAGPRPDTAIVASELLPPGITLLFYRLGGTRATYNVVTGQLLIPLLAVGDSVHLTIQALITDSASGTLVNCIEILRSRQGDPNPFDNKACAPVTLLPCPRIVGAMDITGEDHALPGGTVVRPIVLREYDSVSSRQIRITLRFDSTFARLREGRNIPSMLEGTLLSEWIVTRLQQSRGHMMIELQTPTDSLALRSPGVLLRPSFLLYLGDTLAGPLDVQIELPDRNCTALQIDGAGLRVDSICGLTNRMIEHFGMKYALHPPTPNPFTSIATIDFSIGLDGPVRMDVSNAAGEHVAMLVNEYLKPGEYRLHWNASGMPSGLYYCRIWSGDWNATAALILGK